MRRGLSWAVAVAAALMAILLVSANVLAAGPDGTPKGPTPSRGSGDVVLPDHAVQKAPGVFYLGKALDADGRVVEGYAFVRYKEGFGKPGTSCGNGVCEPGENARKCPADCGGGGEEPDGDTSGCYGFLARGAKWKTTEPYVVNPVNSRELDESFIASNVSGDIDKWEAAAGVNILGDGSVTDASLEADTVKPDEKNEVYFGSIAEPGAIAITIVWGYFGGPPPFRELVEWDQVYDQVDFDWSGTGEQGKMDLENIATHELGHSVGLDDLYSAECSQQTMYGYADYGETIKRSLEAGDIAGVQALYQ